MACFMATLKAAYIYSSLLFDSPANVVLYQHATLNSIFWASISRRLGKNNMILY